MNGNLSNFFNNLFVALLATALVIAIVLATTAVVFTIATEMFGMNKHAVKDWLTHRRVVNRLEAARKAAKRHPNDGKVLSELEDAETANRDWVKSRDFDTRLKDLHDSFHKSRYY